MKTKKVIAVIISVFIFLGLVSGAVYFNKTYARIDGEYYKTDVKYIHPHLTYTKIMEINKCTELEEMMLAAAEENDISRLTDFKKLSNLYLTVSKANSSDSKKISTFSNLSELSLFRTVIDLEGFNNSNLSCIISLYSEIEHFDSLANCSSLRKMVITESIVDDSIIISDGKFVMKNSGFLSAFDNVTELKIYIDSIEDITGICEMDSLKELKIHKGSVSDEKKGLLEDSGIKIIEEQFD